jgi:hypothetical protein
MSPRRRKQQEVAPEPVLATTPDEEARRAAIEDRLEEIHDVAEDAETSAPRVRLRNIETGKVASYGPYRARELTTASPPTHELAGED